MSVRTSQQVSSGGGGGENMFSLKWNQYQSHWTSGLSQLLNDEFSMTDVTLGCEGQFLQAHKLALAVCSPFFKEYFKTYNMDKMGGLIVLANVKFKDLKNLLRFIYHGEVNVSNAELNSFLRTANLLKIEGLMEGSGPESGQSSSSPPPPVADQKTSSLAAPVVDSPALGKTPASCTTSAVASSGISNNVPLSAKRARMSNPVHAQATPNVQNSNLSSASSSATLHQSDPTVPVIDNAATSSIHMEDHADYDPLGMEMEHDEEEQMISFDQVKPEPIAVYTINDEEDDGSQHNHSESSQLLYHDYDSSHSQPQVPGPSCINRSHSQLPPQATAHKSGPATQSTDSVTKLRRPPMILDGRYYKIIKINPDAEGIPVSAFCLACEKTLKGRFDVNSNFVKHLKNYHPESFAEYSNRRATQRHTVDSGGEKF